MEHGQGLEFTTHGNSIRYTGVIAKLKSDLIQPVMYVWSNFANFVTKFRPSNQLRLLVYSRQFLHCPLNLQWMLNSILVTKKMTLN